jgi:nucleoside-triphosphatase THEP1
MGGIGKTTLAKEVYNEYAKQQSFERQSFLHDVRASSLLSLQKQLVHDLLGEDLKSMEEFHNFFNRILRDQKVLIVIDGIDDKWQFDQLIPSLDKLLMQGSQVIVTSRDRNVLKFKCWIAFMLDNFSIGMHFIVTKQVMGSKTLQRRLQIHVMAFLWH